MNKILSMLSNGQQGEVFTRKSHTIKVSYANSQFEDISNNKHLATTLRLIQDGRMSVVSSSQPGSEAVLLENALETVKFGSEVKHSWPGQAETKPLDLYDEQVPQVDIETMVEIADDLNQSLVNYDKRISVMAGVERTESEITLANSPGFSGSYSQTQFMVYLGGQLVQGDDMMWLADFVFSASTVKDFSTLKADVIKHFEWAKNIVPFEPGAYPVIFAPSQLGFLTRPFLACLDGRAVVRDISPWKESIGDKLLDERVTLVDDGTMPRQPSSKPFDREGTPTRRNVLIEKGVPQQLLLDLQYAHELGQESTGNGTTAGPSPHHVLLTPGSESLDSMIKGIDKGLIIFDSMGAWSGNPYSGNVSGTVSMGLKIEKGAIVGRVKDCMFSINSFNHFRDNLITISQDVKNVGASTYPYVALSDVVISTK